MKSVRKGAVILAAVFALTAITGVASASAFTSFNSEKAPVKITGTQIQPAKFKVNAGETTCNTATFAGTSSAKKSSTVTVTPTYTNCNFLGLAVNVKTNGCQYKFFATGSVNVACPSGKKIEFTQPNVHCTVTVGTQTGLKSIAYTNQGAGSSRTVRVTPNVSGIKYTQNANCPGGAGTFSNGTYKQGAANVKGTVNGVQVGVFVS